MARRPRSGLLYTSQLIQSSVTRLLSPTVILNAAAYTAVDRAESEPEIAMAINGHAPRVLAEEAAKLEKHQTPEGHRWIKSDRKAQRGMQERFLLSQPFSIQD